MNGPGHDGPNGGATFVDVVLVLAALSVVLAVIYPRWRAGALEERVETVVGRVDQVVQAAEDARSASGTWPPTASEEDLLPGTAASEGDDDEVEAVIEWRRMESVEVPSPPSADAEPSGGGTEPGQGTPPPTPAFFHRGVVSVHTTDETLLGALARRFAGSFVHDTVWTLLLPRTPASPD